MAKVLYTPEVLGLATSLSAWPWDEGLALKGGARSRSCGSTLMLGLDVDADGRIARVALRPQACAVGQAAAAIFAGRAIGRNLRDVEAAAAEIAAWLAGEGSLPGWRGFEAIAAARGYPARHDAILLAWRAAVDLLSVDDAPTIAAMQHGAG